MTAGVEGVGPDDPQAGIRHHWERAASGWARWEPAVAGWMEPATEIMLDMGGVSTGAKVIDLACGAGTQTLRSARRVGSGGHVVANDIAETMLEHVREQARAAGLANISTSAGPADELDLTAESFDACICRLGLMLFADPARTLSVVHRALRPGGRVAVVVFTTPAANPFMARPMQVLLRHADKDPPTPGQPGIFALGAPGDLERVLVEAGFVETEQRTVSVPLRMDGATQALTMMQEAFGAYRAVLSDSPEEVRAAAWADVRGFLEGFDDGAGFVAPAEVLVAAAAKPSLAAGP